MKFSITFLSISGPSSSIRQWMHSDMFLSQDVDYWYHDMYKLRIMINGCCCCWIVNKVFAQIFYCSCPTLASLSWFNREFFFLPEKIVFQENGFFSSAGTCFALDIKKEWYLFVVHSLGSIKDLLKFFSKFFSLRQQTFQGSRSIWDIIFNSLQDETPERFFHWKSS